MEQPRRGVNIYFAQDPNLSLAQQKGLALLLMQKMIENYERAYDYVVAGDKDTAYNILVDGEIAIGSIAYNISKQQAIALIPFAVLGRMLNLSSNQWELHIKIASTKYDRFQLEKTIFDPDPDDVFATNFINQVAEITQTQAA